MACPKGMRRVALVLLLCAAVGSARLAGAQPGDWGVTRDPFDKSVVARWKAILARNPHDSALTQLVALYRKHRSVAQLEVEYSEQPETWANVVVRARLNRNAAEVLPLYKRAVELDPSDARSWIAIGDAERRVPAEARAAYTRALELALPRPVEKAVLRKLAALPDDVEASDGAYARLIALDPKSGMLWLERGAALMAAREYQRAIDSYDAAEPLLARDRERQLTPIAQRGRALELLGKDDAAIAEYTKAIAKSPSGYYLRAELVERVITIHMRNGTVPALLRVYQRAWPEKSRGHFEWATLAKLHSAIGETDAAIFALQHAVADAPTELATQRWLIKMLESVGRRDAALAQHETAARAMPRDAPIHFELAQRYWNLDQRKLFATLEHLSRTHDKQPSIHAELAELYMKLRRLDLAIREYELLAKLEPDDQNVLKLGDALWTAGREQQAIKTWNRLARANTAKAWATLGNVLIEHELVEDALAAYTKAIERERSNPEYWRARGYAYEVVERWSSAIANTEHAVVLLGTAQRDPGHAARYQLVRLLANSRRDDHDVNDAAARVADWEMELVLNNDLAAGYLAAEWHGRAPGQSLVNILEQLHELVPADHGVTTELVRAYRIVKEHDKAIATAIKLRDVVPARKQELNELIAKIEEDKRAKPKFSWEEDVIDDPAQEIEAAAAVHADEPTRHATTSAIRAGVRIGVGTGLRGPADSYLTVGGIGTWGRGAIALVTRVDLSQRAGEMRSATALAGSVGVAARALQTRPATITLGVAQRFERRFGDMVSDLDHDGLAVDFTFDVVARNSPATVGLRLEQGLYEHARDTSLLFELGVELR
ncbi:MAG TPA: tetratricopeptide repeat protein [Kofleriaceae bacterium]